MDLQPPNRIGSPKEIRESFTVTRKIALGHYENFPVGSILLPRTIRQHFYNLYAFMRTADDFADIPHRTPQERLSLLADWRAQLSELFLAVHPRSLIFLALRETVRQFGFGIDPFSRLLDAFEFDARGPVIFNSFNDLAWYTARSAEPVGELVLGLFGYTDERRIQLSNKICSALQLINFIQDAKEDLSDGRCYFPKEDWIGIESSFELKDSPHFGKIALALLQRAESLLQEGDTLPELVHGRLKFELRAVIIEARIMARKIRELNGDTRKKRPKLNKVEHVWSLARAVVRGGKNSTE